MCESHYFASLYQIYLFILLTIVGLSSTMNVRIVYLDIMRPFAESVLLG